MQACQGVGDSYIDPSTRLRHHCSEYFCNVNNPEESPPDCQHFCPEYYRCLLEEFQKGQKVSSSHGNSPSSINKLVIIAIVLGSVLLVSVLSIVVCIFIRWRSRRQNNAAAPEMIELSQLVPEHQMSATVESEADKAGSQLLPSSTGRGASTDADFPSTLSPPTCLRSLSVDTQTDDRTVTAETQTNGDDRLLATALPAETSFVLQQRETEARRQAESFFHLELFAEERQQDGQCPRLELFAEERPQDGQCPRLELFVEARHQHEECSRLELSTSPPSQLPSRPVNRPLSTTSVDLTSSVFRESESGFDVFPLLHYSVDDSLLVDASPYIRRFFHPSHGIRPHHRPPPSVAIRSSSCSTGSVSSWPNCHRGRSSRLGHADHPLSSVAVRSSSCPPGMLSS